MNDNVSILIVVHNHSEHLERLLVSLSRQRYSKVYFCDAASSDGSDKIIRDSIYGDHLLAKTSLEGFSKNNNDLLRKFNITTEYILLLNPDTYFEMDIIDAFLKEAENFPKAAILSPRVFYPNREEQRNWRELPGWGTVFLNRIGIRKMTDGNFIEEGIIGWCLGAAMFIRSGYIKERGYFLDERYRLYCEDIDLCFDAHQRGWEVRGVASCEIYHSLNEKSSRFRFSKYSWWNLSSIVKFYFKWFRLYNGTRNKVNKNIDFK